MHTEKFFFFTKSNDIRSLSAIVLFVLDIVEFISVVELSDDC